jgi:hypothetical protein
MLAAAHQAGMAKKPANVWPVYGTGESLDRTKYVTSSEIGYCERKVRFDKDAMKASGYSPKEGTTQKARGWGMMERGHNIEGWFIENLARGLAGQLRLILAGDHQRSFADKHQSGTPDGVFLLGDRQFITLEIKSIDPRTNTANLPKETHLPQITQNCDLVAQALDMECLGSLLIYIDASDYEKLTIFEIPFDHVEADRLIARAERILSAASAADLEPEGVHKDHCKYCDHTAQCNALIRKPVSGETINDLKLAAAKLFG